VAEKPRSATPQPKIESSLRFSFEPYKIHHCLPCTYGQPIAPLHALATRLVANKCQRSLKLDLSSRESEDENKGIFSDVFHREFGESAGPRLEVRPSGSLHPQCIPLQSPPGSANSNCAPALDHAPLPCVLASDGSPVVTKARARERHAVLCWARRRRTTRTRSCLPPRRMRRTQ
jgi:hypothetical protein